MFVTNYWILVNIQHLPLLYLQNSVIFDISRQYHHYAQEQD